MLARHSLCASFAPIPDWRYWFCKVIVPGIVFAFAFQVMALGVDISEAASTGTFLWWLGAELLTVAAPFAIGLCALWSANRSQSHNGPAGVEFLPAKRWRIFCFLPTALAMLICTVLHYRRTSDPSSIHNTYREMHWESGLSLIPTSLIFLLALLVWTHRRDRVLRSLMLLPPCRWSKTTGRLLMSAPNTWPTWVAHLPERTIQRDFGQSGAWQSLSFSVFFWSPTVPRDHHFGGALYYDRSPMFGSNDRWIDPA